MGYIIVKINDFFLEWSSAADAPTTFGMNKEQFEAHHHANGHQNFKQRMKRLEKTGTSSRNGTTVEQVIAGNRAGPNESELTFDEVYQAYCLREPIRNGWVVPDGL